MLIYIIVAVCISFLVGYLLGKRYGEKVGYTLAQTDFPLELRQKSLELGYCVLCSSYAEKAKNE